MTATLLSIALYFHPIPNLAGGYLYDSRTNIPNVRVDMRPLPLIQWRP